MTTELRTPSSTDPPILALDLGTHTGWAFQPTTGMVMIGSWDFTPTKGSPEGTRYARFLASLDEFADINFDEGVPFEVLYEDVRRHIGTTAAHVYGGLLAHLKVWCLQRGIVPQPVGVGQIKKFWTGAGNATKEDMMSEARRRGYEVLDDNQADALALLIRRLEEGPPVPKEVPRKTRRAPADRRRPLARRASDGLRAGDGGVPQGGGERQKARRAANAG